MITVKYEALPVEDLFNASKKPLHTFGNNFVQCEVLPEECFVSMLKDAMAIFNQRLLHNAFNMT